MARDDQGGCFQIPPRILCRHYDADRQEDEKLMFSQLAGCVDTDLGGFVVGDEIVRLGHAVYNPPPPQAGPIAIQLDRIPATIRGVSVSYNQGRIGLLASSNSNIKLHIASRSIPVWDPIGTRHGHQAGSGQ